MKQIFQQGDQQYFQRIVKKEHTAQFDTEYVHPVYATFALARDAEWTCRLFVLEMKESDEEGIGTMINIEHRSPALIGQTVQFTATLKQLNHNEVICDFEARVGDRLIATGKQGQKILKKDKLHTLFTQYKN